MSEESFERIMLRDFGIAALLASAVIGLSLVAPMWVVGIVLIVLIPVVGVAVIAHNLVSHRRDTQSQPGTDHAHISEQPATRASTNAPTTHRPADLFSSGRSVRPNVVTAWVDHSWACHWAALHSYRVTRPGR